MDTILKASVVTDVAVFNPQYITTKDGKTVAFKLVLTYSVKDIIPFMLEVEDAESSLADAAVGSVADLFATLNWDEIRGRAWSSALRSTLRRRAGEFGVRISRVQFATLCSTRVIGILHES
jgi:regulator of protease activity HflC (stomatin/prohibitin superfamily)